MKEKQLLTFSALAVVYEPWMQKQLLLHVSRLIEFEMMAAL